MKFSPGAWVAISILVAVIAGLVSGIVAAWIGETPSTCFAWGGSAFIGVGMLGLAAVAIFCMVAGGGTLPASSAPPANSQQGTPSP